MAGSDELGGGDGASEAAAAARLEQALERIAALTANGAVPPAGGLPSGADVREIADKLDGLIARLRAGLGPEQG